VTTFRVWAPYAQREVAVRLGSETLAMTRGEGGWWQLDVPRATHGTDYAFLVDGEGPFPNPRSAWQPQGIDGPSRVVDHAAFKWEHDTWEAAQLGDAIIYELHIGTFTPDGTFDAAIEKLGYLADLGATHVELMPVAEFSGDRGWGYDGVDLFAPHHAYGGPDGLKRLVDACHARGLGVIMDVVYNHLGPSGNHLERYGPYFTDKYATPWGKAVNFDDHGSDESRRFFVDNALMWLRDYRIDGLRLDAIHAILDTSAVHFLEQLASEVHEFSRQTGGRYEVIAESSLNDPRLVWPVSRGGYGLEATWNDDLHHALHCILTGETAGYYADFGTIADLAKALREVYVYDGRFSKYRGRRHGRPALDTTAHNFVTFSQNHDQVGNRAAGERLSHLAGLNAAKVAAMITLIAPTVPLLFMGEEWAASAPFQYFTDHADPELGAAVTRGRTHEFESFGWAPQDVPDPQAYETFARSRLDWDEMQREPHASMLDLHRRLIALRKSEADLTDPDLSHVEVQFDEHERWLTLGRGSITLAVNFAGEARAVPLPSTASALLLATEEDTISEGGQIQLPPLSAAILKSGAA
jgi:maltooligosyltrehalose trehalohydrolase